MKIVEEEIIFGQHKLTLNNQRTLFWRDASCLVIADLHLGKAAHFRRNGIPIPTQTHQKDIDNLKVLLQLYKPRYLLIVGDMFHAFQNQEVDSFATLLDAYADTEVILVKGNHDRIKVDKIIALGVHAIKESHTINNVRFVHQPDFDSHFYQISGHIHPGVTIKLPTRKNIKLPAFIVAEKNIILPAFSQFTGIDTQCQLKEAQYFALYDDGIIKI